MADAPPPLHTEPIGLQTNSWRAWSAVISLALAVFAVTVTEMMPVGLIPLIAADLHVSDGAAGLAVTMYGIIAGLSAPAATAWTHRVDRRILLLAILATFIVGNLATAVVTGYPQLLAIRLAMGLAHGLMWSITASVAIRLVPPASAAAATAAAFSGISLALVLGVPAGTFLGTWIGWRPAFLAVAALTAVAWISVLASVVSLPQAHSRHHRQWRILLSGHRGIRSVLAVTALAVTANYAAYTYIAPFLTHRLGVTESLLGTYLLVYGVAGVIGNFTAGALLTRTATGRSVLLGALAATTVALIVLAHTGHPGWPAGIIIAVWGLSYSALPVILQTMILRRAPHAREAATAIYVMVFNISIAAGALAGALAIDHIATTAPVLIGGLICLAATVTASRIRDRPHTEDATSPGSYPPDPT